MKTIQVYKAFYPGTQVDDATIIMKGFIPVKDSLEEQRDLYEVQAENIADILWSILPRGTLDQLLPKLLLRAASLSMRKA